MAATRWGFLPAAEPALAGSFFATVTFRAAPLPRFAGFGDFFLPDFFLAAMATSFDSGSSFSPMIPALPTTGETFCRGGCGHSSPRLAIPQTFFPALESKTRDRTQIHRCRAALRQSRRPLSLTQP